jgi:hypothetical protein
MDRIPLINPSLVKVVAAQAERTPAPILRAEVVSSELIKADSKHSRQTIDNSAPKDENSAKNESSSKNESPSKEAQQYKVVLKIGNQQLETLSTENLKKGSQLDIKVAPGPELKIINSPQNKIALSPSNTSSNNTVSSSSSANNMSAKAAMQQLLADRIPNIQSQGMSKLIDQLSQLITAGTGTKGLLAKTIATDSSLALKLAPDKIALDILNAQKQETAELGAKAGYLLSQGPQTAKQALANLAYQSLNKQSLPNPSGSNLKPASTSDAQPPKLSAQSSAPLQQVKDWLQQLPNSSDISNSTGLRNALNNTGVRAETQLSQLAQQFAALNKGSQSSQTTSSSSEDKSANTIFQQLQKIQQKIFSKDPEPLAKTDLASIVKNTAQSLESNSQRLLSSFKNNVLNNKIDSASVLTNTSVPSGTATQTAASNWQNPLLHSQAYTTLNELLKDPLLQNPSSNNKFALGQMLNNLADTQVRIPLNWPERNGSDAVMLRTLQNLLGHIEREQGLQSQQSDNNSSNNPNLAISQNQQWLPLLIHHQQQLQLIEFFINKEEKQNAKGEKKNHWFINLHFDLPQLGELGIEISMFDNECSTTFWSESSLTLNQISYHVQPLRERLTEQGIIVSDVQSRHGTLTKRKQNIQQRLVDIET